MLRQKKHERKGSMEIKMILIVILALLIAAILFFTNYKKSPPSFSIEDKCGRFVNLMSHTIADENSCKTRCRSQCESVGRNYGKISFEKKDPACNSCTCYCE